MTYNEITYFDLKDLAIEFGIVKSPLEFENMTAKQTAKLRRIAKKVFKLESPE